MVMNWSHFENALAVSDLEISDLNDIAHGFTHVYYTDR